MDEKVSQYIGKQKSPQKEILERLRKLFLKSIPGCEEKMMWGVPTFSGGKFYAVALKDHVNTGFAVSGLDKDEMALFEGNGKTMRHVKIKSLDEIGEKKLARLIRLVEKKAVCEPCSKKKQ